MIFHARRLGFRHHVETEERQDSIHLLVGVRIDGRLQVLVRFSIRPFRGGCFPVHDARILAVRYNEVILADERHIQSRHLYRKALRDVPDRVVILPR
ncbi:hypothetical protein SDC9_153649 [bioreactor metagenome]|uniref:Uncharacterized protein n=1 Tax=bioreactor metagenome TaxID=1076179 RepID=A0A645F162_9ZZZZ